MKIKFMKQDSIDTLKKRDLCNNVEFYCNETSEWLDKKYTENIFATYDKLEFPDLNLIISSDSAYDYKNMVQMYESLKCLTDSQASDERIWSGLAHHQLWEYMQVRWPLPKNKDKQVAHVLNNYFFWNSTKAVFLNGLSRLWWYARYTYDENLENPYELTEYICNHDINGKIFPLLSCKFAVNKVVFRNIIKSIKEYEETNQLVLSRDQFNTLKAYLNRLSGKIIIDILSYEELKNKIFIKLDKIVEGELIKKQYSNL